MNKRILVSIFVLVVLVSGAQWGPQLLGKFQKKSQHAQSKSALLAANGSQWGSDPFFGVDPQLVQKQLSQPPKPAKSTDSSANTSPNTDNQSANAQDKQTSSQDSTSSAGTEAQTSPSSPSSTGESSKPSREDIIRGY